MPTPKRNWHPEASYHIIARGNHRNDIFKDKGDFRKYISLMKEALEYFQYDNYEIICCCLMDNHVYLFQDRYYSELIENDGQMLEASRYIHLNPDIYTDLKNRFWNLSVV